jgi:hypothetical protein
VVANRACVHVRPSVSLSASVCVCVVCVCVSVLASVRASECVCVCVLTVRATVAALMAEARPERDPKLLNSAEVPVVLQQCHSMF